MFRTYRRPVDLLVAAIENFRKGDLVEAKKCLSEAASSNDLDETIAELDNMNHKAYVLSSNGNVSKKPKIFASDDALDDSSDEEGCEENAGTDEDDSDDETVYSSLYHKNRALASHMMNVLGETKEDEIEDDSKVETSTIKRRKLVKANVAALINSRKTRR